MKIHRALKYLGLVTAYILTLYLLWLYNPMIAREDRLMENGQAVCLAIAFIFSSFAIIRWKDLPLRFFSWSAALLFLSFLLREIDFDRLDIHWIFIELGSGIGRNSILSILWLATLYWGIKKRHRLLRTLPQLIMSKPFVLFTAGAFFYLASWPFDKHIFSLDPSLNVFLEEASECCATLLFALGSYDLYKG